MLLIVVGSSLNGCARDANTVSKQNEIRVGYFPNITHAPAMVGIEAGIFEQYLSDYDLAFQSFAVGNILMDAIATGDIDIGYIGPGPVINRYLQGAKIQVLAGVSKGGMLLISNPSSNIQEFADLSGKIVSTQAIGDSRDMMLRYIMKENDLFMEQQRGTVKHRVQGAGTIQTAFRQNQLDAAMVPEPWGSLLEQQGANVMLEWNQLPLNGEVPAAIIVASEAFIQNNPTAVKEFLAAHKAAIDFINDNELESLTMVQKQILDITKQNLTIEILEKSLARSPVTIDVDYHGMQILYDMGKEFVGTSNRTVEGLFAK